MKLGIIVGSHRLQSQSAKVGLFVEARLRSDFEAETYTFDLGGNPLPLWDESIWEGDEDWKARWSPISEQLSSCDGFVIISPEWSGMVTPGLKNFFLLCSTELAHKPALIVSVSASRGGAYPVAELRQSSYKNTRICYIPEHVIVRNVGDVLNSAESADLSKQDSFIQTRLNFSLGLLVEYSVAMKPIRQSQILANTPKEAVHGM